MVKYTYALFRTKFGKGYGCFAVEKICDNCFLVSASFCSPEDRVNFSKKKARNIAEGRLNSREWSLELRNDSNDYFELISDYLVLQKKTPNWAFKALQNCRVYHTLNTDCV